MRFFPETSSLSAIERRLVRFGLTVWIVLYLNAPGDHLRQLMLQSAQSYWKPENIS